MDAPGPSLPARFVERLEMIVSPERLSEVLAGFSAPRRPAFRVNVLRAETEEVRAELETAGLVLEAVSWYSDAFELGRGTLAELQACEPYRRGEVYVQNPSSMLPPLFLQPSAGEVLLDLCAAPGSKTTQLACLIGDRGRIVANDRSRKRCFRLESVLREQGVQCAEVSNRSGEVFGRVRAGAFDRVLVDAPCSGEGRFSLDDPASMEGWSTRLIKRLASQQRRLLISGLYALRGGGTLVYSTCTLAPEENELVIAKVLRHFDGKVELLEPPFEVSGAVGGLTSWRGRDLDPALARTRRILPDSRHEGFFLACLRRVP
jgi:tRNA (cytosine49-C5)-methyltransferase